MSEIISNMIFWAINFPLLSHFRTALGNMNTNVDLVDRITTLGKMRVTITMLVLRITFLHGRNAL